jgi:hypothetical protein
MSPGVGGGGHRRRGRERLRSRAPPVRHDPALGTAMENLGGAAVGPGAAVRDGRARHDDRPLPGQSAQQRREDERSGKQDPARERQVNSTEGELAHAVPSLGRLLVITGFLSTSAAAVTPPEHKSRAKITPGWRCFSVVAPGRRLRDRAGRRAGLGRQGHRR